MRLRAVAAVAIAVAAAWGAAAAQEISEVVVVDQERLFQESSLGRRVASELEETSNALAAENRAIEAELIAEERDLTERRPELEPAEFRELADAFDAKVEALRAEQDAKARELVALRNAERQRFTQTVGPILLDFMRTSGATVMLDRRSVVAAADRVDVTDALIAEIDARVAASDVPYAPTAERRLGADGPLDDDGTDVPLLGETEPGGDSLP